MALVHPGILCTPAYLPPGKPCRNAPQLIREESVGAVQSFRFLSSKPPFHILQLLYFFAPPFSLANPAGGEFSGCPSLWVARFHRLYLIQAQTM